MKTQEQIIQRIEDCRKQQDAEMDRLMNSDETILDALEKLMASNTIKALMSEIKTLQWVLNNNAKK